MSDWQNRGKRYRINTLAGLVDIYRDRAKPLTPMQRQLLEQAQQHGPVEEQVRARPRQIESAHQRLLATRAAAAWWWPGYMRWEHKTEHWREAERRQMEGAKSGWPDCGLFIPAFNGDDGVRTHWTDRDGFRRPVLCVLELKRPELKPKRGGKGGVTRAQDWWLCVLEGCGFETCVAYGADEAYGWLDRMAGPEPNQLPEEWRDLEAL